MSPALALDDVAHAYGDVRAVDGVTLAVAPGEVVCLLGPSGCGKTTVLRLAAGLERLQQGRVAIHGRVVADAATHVPPERRGVGMVFQDFALFPHLSVLDNVVFGLARGVADRRRRALDLLAQVGLPDMAEAYPHMLSGGQQQRVALARALAPGPSVVLLDEPFSGLDSRLRDRIRDDTLHVLKQNRAAVLMVTHDAEEAMFMADRIAVMRAGRLTQVGRPADLYCRPASSFVAAFFGEVNRIEGVVAGGRVETPFGPVDAAGLVDGIPAAVVIRPEALRLARRDGDPATAAGVARVLAARLLGRTSLVHLDVADRHGRHLHLHARVPGVFLPGEGELVVVALDHDMTFVFPAGEG